MKILAVVVAYFPDLEDITVNIESYIAEIDKLIIWNNTPAQSEDFFQSLKDAYGDKIAVMGTGENEGIGFALNRAAEFGIENHYDFLLTMDQDSCFEQGSMARYIKMIEKVDCQNILMFTPMLRLISGDSPAFEGDFAEKKLSITSGAINPLGVFQKIGFFQEELFIEGVDHEFSWRAKPYNLKILQVNNVYLKHTVGNRKEHNFLGKKLHTYNYAPIRLYYSVRNLTYLWIKYKDHQYYIKIYFYNNIFKRSLAIILLESDKMEKICAMCLGLWHGIKGKLGKLNNL